MIDVQWRTEHLASLGATELPRPAYLQLLTEALAAPLRPRWAVTLAHQVCRVPGRRFAVLADLDQLHAPEPAERGHVGAGRWIGRKQPNELPCLATGKGPGQLDHR